MSANVVDVYPVNLYVIDLSYPCTCMCMYLEKELEDEEDDVDTQGQQYIRDLAKKVNLEHVIKCVCTCMYTYLLLY